MTQNGSLKVCSPIWTNLSNGITSQKGNLAAYLLLSTIQIGGKDVQILCFFWDEFHMEDLHFGGWSIGE